MVRRERVDVLRLRVLLRAGFAAPVDVFAVERLAAGLRAVDARVAPAVADFARVELAFRAPVLRDVVERFAVERFAVDRLAVDFLAAVLREEEREADDPALLLDPSSAAHLPDMTRCAASATASAIKVPSLVALAMTLVAA